MTKTLKVSLSLFRIKAAEELQYRLAAFSGATVSTFWALIEVVVLTIFFTYGNNTGESINGLTLSQGVSYIWLGQLMVMLQMPGIDGDLMTKITNGNIGIDLCRPLDLYWHWYSGTAAGKVNAFVLRGGLVVVCGLVLTALGFGNVGLSLPSSLPHFILFLISLFSAFLFSIAYSMFLTSIRIGISWGDGPINVINVLGSVLSGGYLPLQLWPDFMQNFLRLQPFASYLDTPARLYIGSVTLEQGLVSMLIQLVWIAVFIVSGRIIMNRKLKSVVIQGG